MLNYIVNVTGDLLIAVTLVTLLYTLARRALGKMGAAWLRGGVITGTVASAALSAVKNTTSLIDTNQWNQWIFYLTILFGLLFVVLSLITMRKDGAPKGAAAVAACVAGAALSALLIFYELPDVLGYPKNFHTGGNGVLSMEFAKRFAGWLLGLLLMLLYARYLARIAGKLRSLSPVLLTADAGVLINAVRCLGHTLRPWITRARWLHWPIKYSRADFPWVFPFASFVANNALLFSLLIGGLALVLAAALYIQNLKVTDPYDHAAQLRKLKAACRKNRRNAAAWGVCFLLSVLTLTVGYAYENRVIELSPPEGYEVRGEEIVVLLEQVNDGQLHRFEYKTDNNVNVRWIIIKKPGAGAYGVGLDACDVCGTAGYYQRGEQVVCKRCDVVMNINTIGFKGGCNPIPLSYRVEEGSMIFRLSDILAAEKEFK